MPNSSAAAHAIPYWRLSSFYFFYFAVVGALIPYWGVYLKTLGYNSKDVGVISAIILATRIIAPNFWGWFADKSQRRLSIIRLGSAFACVFFAGVLLEPTFYWLVLLISMYTFFWHAVLPQFEVVTLAHLGKQHHRYGQIRLWGSIGFIVAVAVLGWLFDTISIQYLPMIILSFLTLILLSSFSLAEIPATGLRETATGLWQIIARPSMLSFLAASFLLQLSHGPYYTYYSLYLTENYHYSSFATGMLWALGVVAEVIIFIVMPRIMRHFTIRNLLLISLFITSARWLLIGYCAQWLWVLLFAQLLHAFSFGVTHAASIEIVRTQFLAGHQGQGQALYSSLSFGAGGALGALVGAFVWDYSASGTFLIASVSAFLGLVICYFGLHFNKTSDQ